MAGKKLTGGPLDGISWPAWSAGSFHISIEPGDASAQQDKHLFPSSLEMLQRNGEAAQSGCDPTEGLSAQGRTAAVNIWPETLAWQHYRSRFTGGD